MIAELILENDAQCKQLANLFEKIQQEGFLTELEKNGSEHWESWIAEHKVNILEFLGLSVKGRNKMLSLKDVDYMQKVILASFLLMRKRRLVLYLALPSKLCRTKREVSATLQGMAEQIFTHGHEFSIAWPLPAPDPWRGTVSANFALLDQLHWSLPSR